MAKRAKYLVTFGKEDHATLKQIASHYGYSIGRAIRKALQLLALYYQADRAGGALIIQCPGQADAEVRL